MSFEGVAERLRILHVRYPDELLLEAADVIDKYREALETIIGPADSGPFIDAYRKVGGGYEGLQAIARKALGQ